jgi:hypothetical protein
MASRPDQIDQMRRARTSIVILAIAVGGLYYSTQVNLNHQVWWDEWLALVSLGLFIWGMNMLLEDKEAEDKYRKYVNWIAREEGIKKYLERQQIDANLPPDMAPEDQPLTKSSEVSMDD